MRRFASLLLVLLLVCSGLGVAAAAPEVAGKSCCLLELHTGQVLFEQNAHTPLHPASVTKIMTMLLVMEAIDGGSLSLTDPVTASEAAAAKGGSQIYLQPGEQMTVAEMLKSVAVSSANDCACALAEHLAGSEAAFVEKMNARAAELGMENTHFVNCTGLDDAPDAKNHLTTAYDIALMSRELMVNHPKIAEFTTIWMDTVRAGTFGLSNTNKLIRFYPGATGLKTGFTHLAGYCLSATASRDGLGLVAVVLGAETSQERFDTCKALLDYGFANYTLVTPELDTPTEIPVTLGKTASVRAIPGCDPALLLEKARKGSISTQTQLLPEIAAPVSRGQRLGTVTLRAGEQILAEIPLVAENTVPKLSWWEIFKLLLQQML